MDAGFHTINEHRGMDDQIQQVAPTSNKKELAKKIGPIAFFAFLVLAALGCAAAAPFTGGLSLIGTAAALLIFATAIGVLLVKQNNERDAEVENDRYARMHNNAVERMAERYQGDRVQVVEEDEPLAQEL
jgi:hypothetical protein